MDDTISRQAALDAIRNLYAIHGSEGSWIDLKDARKALNDLPSAQPDVPDTNVGDTISRQGAIDALWKALYEYEDKTEKQFQELEDLDVADWFQHRLFVQNMNDIDRQTILNLPPAQPDLDEWCTDCKEYDQEKHCCPRFNRVIRETLKEAEAEQRWIPIEERLPEDGDRRKFLLSVKWYDDVCDETLECVDDLQYFWRDRKWYDVEEHKEFDDFYTITAWMPLPKPYERSEE